MRTIFHIDVNSAFLSWTSVENLKTGKGPDLREIPAIIGGDQKTRHGVVLAKSIPAKKFGIHTGEPVVNALRKCPNLVTAPPDHDLYHEYSHRMMDFLHSLTPDIEQVSIDECFLDFTGIAHRYASPYTAAKYIKDEIHSRFGFTVNVGISSNKLLAKMASDFEKPDKIHTLFPDEIPQKMWPLPIGELFMAGKSSVKALNNLGIRTIGELAASDPKLITLNLKSHGTMLWNYANGIDNSPVCSIPAEAKGIGNSTTLSSDLTKESEAVPILHSLAESVASRLRKAHKKAGSICVEIKYYDFQSVPGKPRLIFRQILPTRSPRSPNDSSTNSGTGSPFACSASAPPNSSMKTSRFSFPCLTWIFPLPLQTRQTKAPLFRKNHPRKNRKNWTPHLILFAKNMEKKQ